MRLAIAIALMASSVSAANYLPFLYDDEPRQEHSYTDVLYEDRDETTIIMPSADGQSGLGINLTGDEMYQYDVAPDGTMYIFEL